MTHVLDASALAWTTTLQVRLDLARLRRMELIDPTTTPQQILLPIMLKQRELLTGLDIRDHNNRVVPMLTWPDESRSISEQMLLGMAQSAIDGPLKPELQLVIRRFGGDIDEVAVAWDRLDQWGWPHEEGQARKRWWRTAITTDRTHNHPISAEALTSPPIAPTEVAGQVAILARTPAIAAVLRELTTGFIVLARVKLRPDGSVDLMIKHDSLVGAGRLPLRVGVSPHYQFEIELPAGTVFNTRPGIKSFGEGTAHGRAVALNRNRLVAVPSTETKPIEPWAEARGTMLAGYVPNASRGEVWLVDLVGSVRNGMSGLRASVCVIGWLTTALFGAGVVAHNLGVAASPDAAAPLLVGALSLYAVITLQRSDVPMRNVVARWPRRFLAVYALLTIMGAGVLAVHFPGIDHVATSSVLRIPPPLLGRFGWGWRIAVWSALGSVSGLLAVCASYLAWRTW